MNTFKYPMGAVAKDSISGFEGVIIARNAHLFGCAQYGLAPQELNADGSTKKTEYFDEARINIVQENGSVESNKEYDEIFAVSLGKEVQDKVSNFKGKVMVALEQMNNCNSYYVEPPVDSEGKMREGYWFDEGRLIVINEGISPKEVASPKRGGAFSRDLPKVR